MKKILCLLLVVLLSFSTNACKEASSTGEISAPILFETKIDELQGWTLKSEEYTIVEDGVAYAERVYEDEAGLPYRLYILLLDPDKVTLYTGTSNDDYYFMPKNLQTVQGHIDAAVSNGVEVIAGVNGDLFHITGSCSPKGLTIKNGQKINSFNGRPFSGITEDGQYVIGGYMGEKIPQNLQMAVAGYGLLLKDGSLYDGKVVDESFATTNHPRTLAGVREDGTIILTVIDGRQETHSNGASLETCAYIMLSLGAVDAINHDGGGSSTMILRTEDGRYNTMNRPSDGSLRKVYNSILVIKKSD